MSSRRLVFSIAGLLLAAALVLLFFLSPYAPKLPFLASPTPPEAVPGATSVPGTTPTATLPAETLAAIPTVTATPTITPRPTRKSPYPYGLDTPVPEVGFSPIAIENVPQLRPIYSIADQAIWHSAASGDRQKLFVATSSGMLVFDRQGQQIASWPSILTYDRPADPCLSINRDGSRFALITRSNGKWEARIYSMQGAEATLEISLPVEGDFQNTPRIAISPDDTYLVFGAGNLPVRVLSFATKLEVLKLPAGVGDISFTPDSAFFVARRSRELLFWKTSAWKNPANLLLPREDTPYAFSPDGKTIAIAMSAKIRTYGLDTFRALREISVKTSGAPTWQLAFVDENTLRGYGVYWNSSHTKATVDLAEWNIQSGETLRMDTSENDAPNALSALWGAAITATTAPAAFEFGPYNGFRFVGPDMLMVNSQHTACWLKIATGEKNCFNDPQNLVYAAEGAPFREVRKGTVTVLQNWKGDAVFELGPYRIAAVSKTGEFILVNLINSTTDLYAKGKKLPAESVAGILRSVAENGPLMVFSALEKSTATSITLVDKQSRNTLFLRRENFVLKPLVMSNNGTIYFLKFDPDRELTILMKIDPKNYKFSEVVRLELSSRPELMAYSSTGLFALGLQDGSVVIVTEDGGQNTSFQAAHSALGGLSFAADGRALAVASQEGIQVWAVVP